MASYFMRFLNHIRRTTVGRTPTDGWSARRRDFYLTTHSSYKRQTSMSPAGFEPTISAGEWPQNYALDRTATGTGIAVTYPRYINKLKRGTERLNWFNEQWHDKILTEDGMHVLLFSNQMNLWECCTTKTTTKNIQAAASLWTMNVMINTHTSAFPVHATFFANRSPRHCRIIITWERKLRLRTHARTHTHTHIHTSPGTPSAHLQSVFWRHDIKFTILITT